MTLTSEIADTCQRADDTIGPHGIPPTGSVVYKDEYGIRYSIDWETTELDTLIINTKIEDPRIPNPDIANGLPSYKSKNSIIRLGTITTYKEHFIITNSGYQVTTYELKSQEIGKIIFSPCDAKIIDRFCHHNNNYIADTVTLEIDNSEVTWSNGVWINVWGPPGDSIPAGVIYDEDGNPLLDESGNYILDES